MEHIGELVLAIILLVSGYLLKSTFTNKLDSVNTRLDTVIRNQEDHRIELEKVKKDVEANAVWGKEARRKLDDITDDTNTLNRFMDSAKEIFKNIEDKFKNLK